MLWRSLAVVALVFSSTAVAAEPPVPGMQLDIPFAEVGTEKLTLDAFVPPGEGPFPTCILVHGGGWMRGDKHSYIKPLFQPLSQGGFTWFTINYRLAPQHRWPACADDVAAAVKWVHDHAAEYKVDPKRIALIGESAGGHLVSYFGTHQPNDVAAVVAFYAPNDLNLHAEQQEKLSPSMAALLDLTTLDDAARAKLREISPSTAVKAKLPPFLLIHGDDDKQVLFEQSVRFQELMRGAGNTCDLIRIPGGGHGMGGWAKLDVKYQDDMLAWLKRTLK